MNIQESQPYRLVTAKVDEETHLSTTPELAGKVKQLLAAEREEITIKLHPLRGTDLSVRIIRDTIPISEEKTNHTFNVSILQRGEKIGIVNLSSVYEVIKGESELLIQGSAAYYNYTRDKQIGSQFSEVMLLLSPLDDAISQGIANHFKNNTYRVVRTDTQKIKELFEKRGFEECTVENFPIKPHGEKYAFYLKRKFNPQTQ